jgi:hypothetical protein
MPLPPFATLDGEPAPPTQPLPWRGYRDSRPVHTGNGAGKQLQLDGLSNVRLAAKLIYNRYRTREHWESVEQIADFLAGTLWVAQYWVLRNDLEKAKRILHAVLGHANDLGLLPEEADPDSGEMLGNLPQAFVHAAGPGGRSAGRDGR